MNHIARSTSGPYRHNSDKGPGPELMGANTLTGNHVHNLQNEYLGEIKEFMLDMESGRIAYAVMSFGGVFSLGQKLFAVPWSALTLDTEKKRFILNAEKHRIKNAPGFDCDDWPDMADDSWAESITMYYGVGGH